MSTITSDQPGSDVMAKCIESLPNELLAHIFTLGANTPYDEKPFAVLVSSVGRRWRDIAISTPSVWSNLVFTTVVHRDRRLAALWLSRSGAHPLDITIDKMGAKEHIMDIIIPYISRWRRLVVKAWDRDDIEVVLSPLRTASAPLLQHVAFCCLEDEVKESWPSHERCLTIDTPVLRSVRLRGLCLECGPPQIGLTSIQLDSHEIFFTHREIYDFLSASPGLTTLMLRLLRVELPGDTNLPVIELSSLRSLAMNFRHCELSFVYLFACFSTPALDCLELIHMNRIQTDEFNTYCSRHSLSPQYPNLQKLKLFSCGGLVNSSDGTSEDHMMEDFLAFFPTITSLYRMESKTKLATPPHFPYLKYITFSSTAWNETEWLYDEIEARRGIGQQVLHVRLSRYTHLVNESALSRLDKLVEVVQLDDDSDSFRYTGESDDEMEDDYVGSDKISEYSNEEWDEWENDEEVDEDAWNSDSDY